MTYLYSSPGLTPATKPHQTPLVSSGSSGAAWASQPLKSPTTWTLRTSGAHTAKR